MLVAIKIPDMKSAIKVMMILIHVCFILIYIS